MLKQLSVKLLKKTGHSSQRRLLDLDKCLGADVGCAVVSRVCPTVVLK